MALTRRLRKTGSSLSVIVPADFVKALGLTAGDLIEFIPDSRDTFRIRRAPTPSEPGLPSSDD